NERRVAEILARPYSFIAVADQDDGGWVVFYPDLPGVMTQADTYEEVAFMAKEALELWVEFQVEDGRPVPEPTFEADPDWDWDTVRPTSEIPTMTTAEVAEELEISVPRVHQLARSREVGEKHGNALMFSKKDVEAMRDRKPGRPKRDMTPV
ncbi:MAG: type II toxin-antitoxin system HicB family antitoxin, partial [Chloroflexota bacterium]|nr:type II toxin-antitoxin system HicB family antitoxin [Chloroflexota bacterium]